MTSEAIHAQKVATIERCSLCGKQFDNERSLYQHRKDKHGISITEHGRQRYLDKHALPTNARLPRGDWKRRHRHRNQLANSSDKHAAFAFMFIGGWLRIHNKGEHWQIVFRDGDLYQWWPSTAKLVNGSDYQNGYHAHTWKDVFKFVLDQRGE